MPIRKYRLEKNVHSKLFNTGFSVYFSLKTPSIIIMSSENTILVLKLPTDPRWVNIAAISLQDILTDHAFCEQKAATQFISIIQKHSDKTELIEALAPVVTEEWGHFRMVLAELKKRGMSLGKQRKDEYVNLLVSKEPKNISSEERLLHKLMICALIEARS